MEVSCYTGETEVAKQNLPIELCAGCEINDECIEIGTFVEYQECVGLGTMEDVGFFKKILLWMSSIF